MTRPPAAMRKNPRQARAEVTVETMLEAAAQLLASSGETGVTTATVAKRAGVSIGTVYQYFPHRDAILLELARRDHRAIERLMRSSGTEEAALRPFVRDIIRIYRRRIGARRQFAVMAEVGFAQPGFGPTPKLPDVVRELWTARGLAGDLARDAVRATVLVRAVGGVLRAAAAEGAAMLDDPRLEDDFVDLIGSLFRVGRSGGEGGTGAS